MYPYASLTWIIEVEYLIKGGMCEVISYCELVGTKRKFNMLINNADEKPS